MNFKEGSIWKPWDLHAHTPIDLDWENRPTLATIEDKKSFAKEYINFAEQQNLSAIAITDHNFCNKIDDLLIPYIEQEAEKKGITIFPGFEITAKDGSGIHLLVIFPEKTRPDLIKGIIDQCFSAGTVLIPNSGFIPVSTKSIDEIKDIIDKSKLEAVFIFAHVDRENGVLNHGTITGERRVQEWHKDYVKISQISKSPRDYQEDTFMHNVINKKDDNYDRDMAYILASDCRSINKTIISEERCYLGQKYTWIKADTTFEGLKQITRESQERIYIGHLPPIITRVHDNKTKYIDSVEIDWIDGYTGEKGEWFKQVKFPLNMGLTAIIGNKGNGKSALADIIGLLGNSEHGKKTTNETFSFLNKEKFRKPGYAENYKAKLNWKSGNSSNEIQLSHVVEDGNIESVKYIPQNYFEQLCNETDEAKKFREELNKVIFSHLPDDQKLDCSNFDELISSKRTIIDKAISEIKSDLDRINTEIIMLETKKSPLYLSEIKNNIALKQRELETHIANKPDKDPEPVISDKATNEEYKKMLTIREEISAMEKDLEQKKQEKNKISNYISELQYLIEYIDNIENYINNQKNEEAINLFSKYGFDINKLISIKIDKDQIETLLKKYQTEYLTIDKIVNEDIEISEEDLKDNYYFRLGEKRKTLQEIKDKLEAPTLKYQESLEKYETWEKKYNEINGIKYSEKIVPLNTTTVKLINDFSNSSIQYINGKLIINNLNKRILEQFFKTYNIISKDKQEITNLFNQQIQSISLNSLEYYKQELEYLENELDSEIIEKRLFRLNKSIDIFKKKQEIANIYKTIKSSIDKYISDKMLSVKDFGLSIEASFSFDNDFIETFMTYINKAKPGSFKGIQDGQEMLLKILENKDLNRDDSVRNIINELMEKLEHDYGEKGDQRSIFIHSQIKDNKIKEFYNYLFSLDYLIIHYDLMLGEKTLKELSPGEKGALLLIFYLLLDKNDIPLIIDQPEDNLDNQSVSKLLVPSIKQAKKGRQIVMVTHNPNLAVVADAEEIIYVKINKANDYKVDIISGAIENPIINKSILDVLEGTQDAFTNRQSKYNL